MRWNDMTRSIAFAAAASIAAPVYWYLASAPYTCHVYAHGHHIAAFFTLMVALYAWGIAPGHGHQRRSSGIAAAMIVMLAGGGAWLTGGSTQGVLVVCALALAGVRSLLLHPPLGASAILREAAIFLGSLLLAGWMMQGVGHGPLALGAAAWAFFLVQSLFFLTPGRATRAPAASGDAFEQATRQLRGLLDDGLG